MCVYVLIINISANLNCHTFMCISSSLPENSEVNFLKMCAHFQYVQRVLRAGSLMCDTHGIHLCARFDRFVCVTHMEFIDVRDKIDSYVSYDS